MASAKVLAQPKTSAKTKVNVVLMYATLALTSVCCGNVLGGALPFGAFVGATYSANPFISAAIYVASAVVFGLQSVAYAAVRAAVTILFVVFHKIVKKKIRKWHLLLYLVAANVFYCAYGTEGYFQLFDKLLYVACGIAFSFVCIYFFRAVFVRGLAYRPALDEVVCICLFAIVVGYGVSAVQLWGLEVIYFFIPLTLLFCCCVLGDKATLVCACLLGMGNLLATGTYDCCVFCLFCALAIVVANKLNRFVAGLASVIVDVVMSYFLGLHGNFSTVAFVPTVCSVVVFFVVPGSVHAYLRDCVGGNNDRYVGKSVVKKLGVYTAKKLYRLSDIFLSMKNAFFAMSVGEVSAEDAQKAIVRQCCDVVCKDCAEKTRCWRQNLTQTEQSLLQIAQCAVKRGKCTILDVPQNLSLKCGRVSTLLAEINLQSKNYRDYASRVEQCNNGKLLLGEQLGGVSHLLAKLASDCKSKVSYNSEKEKELVERLVFHNVLCCGAVVMEQSSSVTVIVTVAKKDADHPVVEQVASKLLGQPFVVEKEETTESDSWVNLHLAPKPRFCVSFGVAAVAKDGNEVSGDTHSVMKTDNGKCIVALCDGMGSGACAERTSATAIGLVENFYRAGFDNDTILSCVNRLLVGSGNEDFCAVDICVVDTFNGLMDFIKLGSPVGLVRCAGTVEIVSGSSLPLGVLDEMKPSVTKKALAEGDVAVLLSDGITDCFSDANVVASVLAETSCTNPQSIAEMILNRALKACDNKPHDDMTVVVVKLS